MIKFENPINKRYYYLLVTHDLLNDFVLTIIRGGIDKRIVRHLGYTCSNALQQEIERISKRRLQRGYEIVN